MQLIVLRDLVGQRQGRYNIDAKLFVLSENIIGGNNVETIVRRTKGT